MKAPPFLIALALAGCQKAAAETDITKSDSYKEAEAAIYKERIREGWTPEQARQSLQEAREMSQRIMADPEIEKMEQARQRDLAELHNSACKNDPTVDPYC